MRKTAAILGLLIVNSPAVWACGICVSAMADAVLPPIYWWAGIGSAWFLGTATIAVLFRTRLPTFPPPLIAFALPPVLLLASAIYGTGPLVLLIPAAAIPFVTAILPAHGVFTRRSLRMSVLGLGAIGTAAVLVLAAWSYGIHTTRTRVDFLLQWSGTASERRILHKMTEEDPEPLEEYRYLYPQAGLVTASFVAKRIGEIGDPKSDIPLLESRLEDFRAESWADMYLEDVEGAIANLKRKKAKPLDSEAHPE